MCLSARLLYLRVSWRRFIKAHRGGGTEQVDAAKALSSQLLFPASVFGPIHGIGVLVYGSVCTDQTF